MGVARNPGMDRSALQWEWSKPYGSERWSKPYGSNRQVTWSKPPTWTHLHGGTSPHHFLTNSLWRWWLPRSKPSCLRQACFEVLAAVNLGSTVHILGMVWHWAAAMSVGAHSSSNSSTRCKKPKKAISWPRILVTQWALKAVNRWWLQL